MDWLFDRPDAAAWLLIAIGVIVLSITMIAGVTKRTRR
jgi:hypothetical protein